MDLMGEERLESLHLVTVLTPHQCTASRNTASPMHACMHALDPLVLVIASYKFFLVFFFHRIARTVPLLAHFLTAVPKTDIKVKAFMAGPSTDIPCKFLQPANIQDKSMATRSPSMILS